MHRPTRTRAISADRNAHPHPADSAPADGTCHVGLPQRVRFDALKLKRLVDRPAAGSWPRPSQACSPSLGRSRPMSPRPARLSRTKRRIGHQVSYRPLSKRAAVDTDCPGGTDVMLRHLRYDDAGRDPRLTQARRKSLRRCRGRCARSGRMRAERRHGSRRRRGGQSGRGEPRWQR